MNSQMHNRQEQMEQLAIRCCQIVPILLLAWNALAWLRWGTDLPYLDDWHVYMNGQAGSLNPAHLTKSVNNTISPVGLALDALVQRWLGGHVVLHQLLSMLGVLGGLLWCQARLLAWATPEPKTRAIAFLLTAWMMQTPTYWGEQTVAYHQALPLLCLMAALALALTTECKSRVLWPALVFLGLLGAFAYISGAVAMLVAGICFAALSSGFFRFSAEIQKKCRRLGGALLLAGVPGMAVQYYKTRIAPDDEVSRSIELTWPNQFDFWPYWLGKIGRALGSWSGSAALEITLAAACVAALGGLIFYLLRGKGEKQAGKQLEKERIAVVLFALAGVVLVYLATVTMGRAAYRGEEIQSFARIFEFAYERFHFFWVTILFPWMAAAVLHWRGQGGRALDGRIFAGVLIFCLIFMGWKGFFKISDYYEEQSQLRAEDIACLQSQRFSAGVVCKTIPGEKNWAPAYQDARKIRASFLKYFPVIEREPSRPWLWALSQKGGELAGRWSDVQTQADGWMMGGADPSFTLDFSAQRAEYAACQLLEVRLRARFRQPGRLQLFFVPLGQRDFQEGHSRSKWHEGEEAGAFDFDFLLRAPDGFDPYLRIDPVDGHAGFRLEDVNVACLEKKPAEK